MTGPVPLTTPARPADSPARVALGAAFVFALYVGVFWLDTRLVTLPPAWMTFEFCQYAEIGRSLAHEGTFDTRLVEPMALAYLDRLQATAPDGRWPVINRYPWPCLVIAALMRAFGPTDAVAAWSNGLAGAGLAALAYALARRWYGRGWAAVVALLVLANPSFSGAFVLLGTPDVWFALLFALELLGFAALIGPEPADGRVRPGLAAMTGVLAGLALLARFNATIFLAPQAIALIARRRWRDLAMIAGAGAVIVAPLVVYNVRHLGRPFVSVYSAWNLLDDIGAYRVEPWLYYRVPDVGAEILNHLGGLASKIQTNLTMVILTRVGSLWNLDLILPLAVVGLILARPGTIGRRFLVWASALFLMQLLLFSALRLELEDRFSPHHGRYFFWFALPAVLLGVGVLRDLSGRSRWLRAASTLVVLAELGLFTSGWWHLARSFHGPTNLGRDPIRQMLTEVVTDNRLIASNQPQLTTWFCGLRSVSLPANPGELARLNRGSASTADYLLVDVNANFIDLDPRWGQLVTTVSPWEPVLLRDYQYVLPPARTRPFLYVLLRRREIPPSPLERRFNPATMP